MYSDRWSLVLRQGDIAGPISLPLLGTQFEILSTARSLTTEASAAAPGKILVDAAAVYIAVVSHDCEFNEDKRNKLLVARLQKVQGNLTDTQVQALWASNDVVARAEREETIAAVDSFVVEPLPGQFEDSQVINFATTTPLPMSMKQDLAETKKAEMTQDSRVLLRRKLAWFFGRDAEDVSDEEKRPKPEPATETGDGGD